MPCVEAAGKCGEDFGKVHESDRRILSRWRHRAQGRRDDAGRARPQP
jgi:hypothetical protein